MAMLIASDILKHILAGTIYDALKARFKKREPLTKEEAINIISKALHDAQEIYLDKQRELLEEIFGKHNGVLVNLFITEMRKLLKDYSIPPDMIVLKGPQSARLMAREIAQNISSQMETQKLFSKVTVELLSGDDFELAPSVFSSGMRLYGDYHSKYFLDTVKNYLALLEVEAKNRISRGSTEVAILLLEKAIPAYSIILKDRTKVEEILDKLNKCRRALYQHTDDMSLFVVPKYFKILNLREAAKLYEQNSAHIDAAECYFLIGEQGLGDDMIKKLQSEVQYLVKKAVLQEVDFGPEIAELSEKELIKLRHAWSIDENISELYKVDEISWFGLLRYCLMTGVRNGGPFLAAVHYGMRGNKQRAIELYSKVIPHLEVQARRKALLGDWHSLEIFLKIFHCYLAIGKVNDAKEILYQLFGINKLPVKADIKKLLSLVSSDPDRPTKSEMMDVDEMIEEIVKQAKVSHDKILSRVEQKQDELKGFVTPEGAAIIIGREFGVDFYSKFEVGNIKIENLFPGWR